MQMRIPLSEAELHLDEDVLEAGLGLVEKGKVLKTEYLPPRTYEAQVQDRQLCNVILEIEKDYLVSSSCSCKDKQVCKHAVAALFSLIQEDFEVSAPPAAEVADVPVKKPNKAAASPKPKKEKSAGQEFKDILKTADRETLVRFLEEYAYRESAFKTHFISYFSQKKGGNTREYYEDLITKLLKPAIKKYREIDVQKLSPLYKTVSTLLKTAGKNLSPDTWTDSFNLCQAVINTIIPLLKEEYYYNSNKPDKMINAAIELLQQLPTLEMDTAQRAHLFDFCVENAKVFRGDMQNRSEIFLQLAAELADNEKMKKKFFTLVDKMEDYDSSDTTLYNQLRYKVMIQAAGPEAARQYAKDNVNTLFFRNILIEDAFNRDELAEARKIFDGTVDDDITDEQSIMEWLNWGLKLGMAEQKPERIASAAMALYNTTMDASYLEIVKKNVPTKKWQEMVETMTKHMEQDARHFSRPLADIYILNEQWDTLLKHMENNPSLNLYEHCDGVMIQHYPEATKNLYTNLALDYFARSFFGDMYKYGCAILARMNQLGFREEVDEIKDMLRKSQKNTPALLKELDRMDSPDYKAADLQGNYIDVLFDDMF